MKNLNKLWLVFFCFLSHSAFANSFGDIDGVLGEADASASSALGMGLKWFFAVILPIMSILGSMIIGYMIAKNKVDQSSQNQSKILWAVLGSAIFGVFVYIFITSLLSVAMTGDAGHFFSVVNDFYLGL